MKRKYDSTVARIAGNLLSGMSFGSVERDRHQVLLAVQVARLIVAECERTEQPESDDAVGQRVEIPT